MDSYGTDLLLTNDGDFAVTPAGQLALVSGPMNCAQALISRLRVYPEELPLRPDYGEALAARVVGTKTGDPTLLVSALNAILRRIMESDRRFLRAQNVSAAVHPAYPAASAMHVELVLSGGDRLITDDLAGSDGLALFTVAPEITEDLDPDEFLDLAGPNPDDDLDAVPDLEEELEGEGGDFSTPVHDD